MDNTEYTKKLAGYAVDLKYEDLPKEVIEQAKLLTLHTTGVALASYPTEQGKKAIALAKDMGGEKRESTIFGDGGKVPCLVAGFVNGTLADALDWEDCSWTGHPSSGAIPAALAVGERVKASGKQVITSVVAGYELYERIAMAVQPSREFGWMTKGWGLTSWVIYASAIPAAKLLNLDKEQMENVIAIAGALTPIVNVKAHLARTDFYHYQWGMSCMNGITAALMGESGITRFPDFLDGDSGYWVTVSDKCDWEWYDKNLGKDYLIMETYFKHWPTNMWINQPLDGIDAIMKKYKVKAEDVEQIIVAPEVENRMAHKPEGYGSIMDAQFSIPYCIAVLMLDPEPGPNWYTEERRRDPRVLELASKVKAEGPVVTLQEAFEQFRAGEYLFISIQVRTKDGRVLKEDVPLPIGHPRNRMSTDEFRSRFRRAASFALKPEKIEKAIDMILNLEEVEDISEVGDLMSDH
jgi:2-methylcitrate dehydratase PrpD